MAKYAFRRKKGNIGEAFVQYILSDFCLVHKIDGSKDIGNDMICELIQGESPTNILFYVQVKYWDTKTPTISEELLEYWKGSLIPVYLFWVKSSEEDQLLPLMNINFRKEIKNLEYRRYTPEVHGNDEEKNKEFHPFSKKRFFRDLMVDYARCQYVKGFTPIIKKNDFIELDNDNFDKLYLKQNCLFIDDLIPDEYAKNILNNSWVNILCTAILLHKNDNRTDKPCQLIRIAKELFDMDINNGKNYPDFIEIFEKRIKEMCDITSATSSSTGSSTSTSSDTTTLLISNP